MDVPDSEFLQRAKENLQEANSFESRLDFQRNPLEYFHKVEKLFVALSSKIFGIRPNLPSRQDWKSRRMVFQIVLGKFQVYI